MEEPPRFGTTFGLAGWLFAELMLVLAVVFIAADRPERPRPSSSPTLAAPETQAAEATIRTLSAAETALLATVDAQATEAAAAEATIVAMASSQEVAERAMATAEGLAVAAQSTAAALETQQAQGTANLEAIEASHSAVVQTATALSVPTTPLPSTSPPVVAIDPTPAAESIQVDADGILTGDSAAVADARGQLADVLDGYRGRCRAGIVLTFAHGTLEESTALAEAVNDILVDEFPDLFEGTALNAFIDLNPPRGQIDLRIYFIGSCPPPS